MFLCDIIVQKRSAMKHTNKQAADGVLPKFPVVAPGASSDIKVVSTGIGGQDVTVRPVVQDDKRSNPSGIPSGKTEYRIW